MKDKEMRPWGSFQCIEEYDNVKIKRLVVNSNSSISLQYHRHRAEHWVVIKGEGVALIGSEVHKLSPNMSTYIPIRGTHRLTNTGDEPLEIVEVQTGDYLEEDDIVRMEDMYGRR